jgi:hypothetical protein
MTHFAAHKAPQMLAATLDRDWSANLGSPSINTILARTPGKFGMTRNKRVEQVFLEFGAMFEWQEFVKHRRRHDFRAFVINTASENYARSFLHFSR